MFLFSDVALVAILMPWRVQPHQWHPKINDLNNSEPTEVKTVLTYTVPNGMNSDGKQWWWSVSEYYSSIH
jgi:hypothetical protein